MTGAGQEPGGQKGRVRRRGGGRAARPGVVFDRWLRDWAVPEGEDHSEGYFVLHGRGRWWWVRGGGLRRWGWRGRRGRGGFVLCFCWRLSSVAFRCGAGPKIVEWLFPYQRFNGNLTWFNAMPEKKKTSILSSKYTCQKI